MAFTVQRQLPGFDWAKGDGQAGGFSEGAFVFLEDFGTGEGLDEVALLGAVMVSGGRHGGRSGRAEFSCGVKGRQGRRGEGGGGDAQGVVAESLSRLF